MYTLLPFRFLQATQQYLKLIMTSESRVGIVLTPGNYLVTEFGPTAAGSAGQWDTGCIVNAQKLRLSFVCVFCMLRGVKCIYVGNSAVVFC